MAALYRLVNEDPPRTELAGWLEPLLLASMHRDPAGRWTSAQVAAFLEHGPAMVPSGPLSGGPPTLAAPPPSASPPDVATQVLPAPRRRVAAPLLAAALLVL